MNTQLNQETFSYSTQTLERAEVALACSPFCLRLFQNMRQQSVPIQQIAEQVGIDAGYSKKALSEPKVDDELGWLIKVGLLRREVDGQGLTDSFRLTPLGRQVVDLWESSATGIPAPSLANRVFNSLNRWLRLSF